MISYISFVAVEVTDCEGNLVNAREKNSRSGVGCNYRFTEDVFDSSLTTHTPHHPGSFIRYGAQASGTYQIQGDGRILCTIRIYEYEHTTNNTEIYQKTLDDITNVCEIVVLYMGFGKIEVYPNKSAVFGVNVHESFSCRSSLSDIAQYSDIEVAKSDDILRGAYRKDRRRSFSQVGGILSLGRPENYPRNYGLEMRVPRDNVTENVAADSWNNKQHRCTIL
ncbi:MAG: hypothetical protein ACR2HS_01875 [Gammaproteobacteria bacterium]